MMKEEDKELIS